MKVKSESEVAQSCPTPSDPIHGIFQARVLEWGAVAFSETSLNASGSRSFKRATEVSNKQQTRHGSSPATGSRKRNLKTRKTFESANI